MSNLIFGDGAGAAVLESGPGSGIDVVDTASFLVPGSERRLGFDLTDAGFTAVLDRRLPDIVPGAMVHAAGELLRRHGLTPADVTAWLLHPGGARILSGIEHCLDIGRDRTGWTRESMHDHGNASSAAIFDVLARYFERPVPDGNWIVVGAFGPGVSIDLILGRQVC
jgi:alkylresorcinol/alkylpyrone synthase